MTDSKRLVIIQVGNEKKTNERIKDKVKKYKEMNITVDIYQYPEDITEIELCEAIKLDQNYYDGVIIQSPLPAHIRHKAAVAAIHPYKRYEEGG